MFGVLIPLQWGLQCIEGPLGLDECLGDHCVSAVQAPELLGRWTKRRLIERTGGLNWALVTATAVEVIILADVGLLVIADRKFKRTELALD